MSVARKSVTHKHSRTSAGSELQMDGAIASEKARRRAMSVLVLGATSLGAVDDCSTGVWVTEADFLLTLA